MLFAVLDAHIVGIDCPDVVSPATQASAFCEMICLLIEVMLQLGLIEAANIQQLLAHRLPSYIINMFKSSSKPCTQYAHRTKHAQNDEAHTSIFLG